METSQVVLAVQLIVALYTTWIAFRKLRPQILVDGSTAAVNFQSIVLKLQTEVGLMEAKIGAQDEIIDTLKNTIKRARLEVVLSVGIDIPPTVVSYKWGQFENKA